MSQAFRTEIQPRLPDWKIHHQSPVLSLGSCFAERTGERLFRCHIPVSVNPWGTLFNPVAIEDILSEALSGRLAEIQPVAEHEEVYYSLRFPSALHGHSPEELQDTIQESHRYIAEVFPQFRYIIITLGTAWVYRHRLTGRLVASCHKVPAREFDKILLTPDQVVHSLGEIIAQARALRPDIRFIFTVSPVRHTKDTLELNAVSKSVLRYACHQITEIARDAAYFPAYEILMDDLRDYRFYAADQIHPSEEALQYIWDVFSKSFFSPETIELNEAIESVVTGLAHRPRVIGKSWLKHLTRLEEQVEKISRTWQIRLDREWDQIQQLKAGIHPGVVTSNF
jgi:hypothetical protein